jgi:glycerol-3-phosphate acyltransferase PlsY
MGVAGAYLIGSFSTAVWFGKLFYNTDIRKHGSGNAGATNTLRVLGPRAGLLVLMIDALKGWLAIQIYHLFETSHWTADELVYYQMFLAAGVVTGHILPVYTRFKGGKGVATLLGVVSAMFPWQLIVIEIGLFALIFGTTRFVSLGSLAVALAFPILAIWGFQVVYPLKVLSVLVAIIIPVTHKKNIERLIQGRESKISFNNVRKE